MVIDLFYSKNLQLIWLDRLILIFILVEVIFDCFIDRTGFSPHVRILELNIQDIIVAEMGHLLSTFSANHPSKAWFLRTWVIVKVVFCDVWQLEVPITVYLRLREKCFVVLGLVLWLPKCFYKTSATSLSCSVSVTLRFSLSA